ncbi:MAG: hypothetical protein A2X05_02160 [Bacteroidetes bacterium GWE2_41_25]|nr:MAG: hypothetical protein A2X05_02160 [Bacteroidetes bacterium GWE2_41_25]
MPRLFLFLVQIVIVLSGCVNREEQNKDSIKIKVATAAKHLVGHDSMVIAGSIQAGYAHGEEAPIRTTALVIDDGETKLCIITCDVTKVDREFTDDVAKKIEAECGIPFENILFSASHTHHAPATVGIHGYSRDENFVSSMKGAMFTVASEANEKLRKAPESSMYFWLGQEATVGQNSRLLLSDSTVNWAGPRDDAIRPTGTFDPELPVIAFKSADEELQALLFNHSTHNIGSRKGRVRSPGFYGLAAQELEQELGGNCLFLLGAAGSVHALALTVDEKVFRIKEAVKDAYNKAEKKEISKLVSVKEEFKYKVRKFNEEEEDKAVSHYCHKRGHPESTIETFRTRRKELAQHQGEVRKTWLQVMQIGEVAIVGVSGELFNDLGIEIKRLSPFRYTYIVGLANDYIGYIPDEKGFDLGGYQVWTGAHSLVSKGTGEAIVDRAVEILNELYKEQ